MAEMPRTITANRAPSTPRLWTLPRPLPSLPAASAPSSYFVYDALGQLAAEYEDGPEPAAAARCTTCYLFTDHLGSTRVMWDADTAGVKARYDYLPFGEFVPATKSGRTSASCAVGVADCYPGSGTVTNARVTQMFTGKERDTETGLVIRRNRRTVLGQAMTLPFVGGQ